MKWTVVDSGAKRASENMALDYNLLLSLKEKPRPILHLYDWTHEAATYGHFIKPADHLNVEKTGGLDLAKRPTGGGIVFHIADLAFSVLVPDGHSGYHAKTLDNYHWVNRRLQRALEPYVKESKLLAASPEGTGHFCMAKPTIYDVMAAGKKVGGAAQRRMRFGYLHQGTISVGKLPEAFLEEVLWPDGGVLEAMRDLTFAILPEGWTRGDLEEMRGQLKRALQEVFVGEVRC